MTRSIVHQMRPSPEQEPAIVERGRDVVVIAGAGTGKTRTLVARTLSLLAEGVPLRAIVAITFTKKAAREMRNRVREEVRVYLERADLPAGERGRWQDLYTALDTARIGTIHSLCVEILRAHPAEAGVDPRFEMLEEGQSHILRRRALDETLTWIADDERCVVLFSLLGERDLRDRLEALVRQRLDAREALDRTPDDVLAHWQQVLAGRQRDALEALTSRAEWKTSVDILRTSRATDADDLMEVQRRAALAAIEGAQGTLADRLSSLACLDGINLGGGRQGAWPGGKEELRAVKAALKSLRALWRDAADVLGLRLTPLDETLAQAMPALRAAFTFACRRYDALKRERNALDFDDLEHGALALLREKDAVRDRWQREVRALLVDEFQDTNSRQRDLVRLLNGDEDKLFIVGDAKQSIYRFRGADVTVFRTERRQIEACGGAVFPLETSYRAHRALVERLNDLLRPVLGEEADPNRPWAEPFSRLLHHREAAGPGFTSPYVELHLTVGSKSGGALDRAAGALAARIVELVEAGRQTVEGGRARPLDYGDVAILCRASSSFASYEDGLERAGVPFLTVAGRGFHDRAEIRDLLNALQALADPTDDLALAGLLRSPAFGLSDAALYRTCAAREQTISLWDVLREAGVELGDEDGRRAGRALRILTRLHHQVGRSPVADVLKGFLDETGYRAALIQAGQARGARNVSKLLADAQTSGLVTVGQFLEYVRGLRDSGTREGEARATAEGAVQIMSVHAAKGLEFPVVAIGDVTYGGWGAGGLLVDDELGVLLPLKDEEGELPAAYRLGKSRAEDQEAAESDRLLYVAATRAREKLLLNGCIGLKKDGTPGRLGGWLGKLDGSGAIEGWGGAPIPYDENGARALHLELRAGGTPVACTIYEPGCAWTRRAGRPERVPEPIRLPPPLLDPLCAGVEEVDSRLLERERIPPHRVWRVVPAAQQPRAPAWVIGSLVHEALAAWRFPDASFEQWAEARARGYGITDARELGNAIDQSRRLLLRFRSHPLCGKMERADRRLHEVLYSLEREGRVESGIIDALYLHEGEWTIVEFKTDEVKDQADFERLLKEKEYVTQAQRYVAAAQRLLGQRPRCILCMLNWNNAVQLYTDEPWSTQAG